MTLPPLHLPLISAGFLGGVLARMLEFVTLRIRRSDQGMSPSLSPDLRAQTVALHRRLTVLTREFHRLAELARQGRLRVYPDRASPRPRAQDDAGGSGCRTRAQPGVPADPAFAQPPGVAQGPSLPAVPTRGFGWMLGFVPAEYGPALAALLTNSEMVSLIQASPAVARLLRPLCRGLGVTPPEGVFPAPRRRAPRAAPGAVSRARTEAGSRSVSGPRPAPEPEPGSKPGPEPELEPETETGDAGAGGEASARAGYACAPDGSGAARSGIAHAPRHPVADAMMSPQARDRWWAQKRAAGRVAAEIPAKDSRRGHRVARSTPHPDPLPQGEREQKGPTLPWGEGWERGAGPCRDAGQTGKRSSATPLRADVLARGRCAKR